MCEQGYNDPLENYLFEHQKFELSRNFAFFLGLLDFI
jgi:hypothetical protein